MDHPPLARRHRAGPRLNLVEIEAALRGMQAAFPGMNREAGRDPMDGDLVENILLGYAQIDRLLAAGVDLFAPGNSERLLELNTLVLCGMDAAKRLEYQKHIAATRRYFYDRSGAGIQDLAEWHALHRQDPIYRRAAGAFIRIVSEPQLFIEGNGRTGALVMAYLLAQAGLPPFVLTAANATAYFDYTDHIKKTPKNNLASLFLLPRLKTRLAEFLLRQANPEYLL